MWDLVFIISSQQSKINETLNKTAVGQYVIEPLIFVRNFQFNHLVRAFIPFFSMMLPCCWCFVLTPGKSCQDPVNLPTRARSLHHGALTHCTAMSTFIFTGRGAGFNHKATLFILNMKTIG